MVSSVKLLWSLEAKGERGYAMRKLGEGWLYCFLAIVHRSTLLCLRFLAALFFLLIQCFVFGYVISAQEYHSQQVGCT